MAEPRGRDGEALEVKSAGGVSPPAGGYGGLPRICFEKKWCHLVQSEIFLGAFLNALKHHVYGAGKSFFTAPPPIIRPFWKLFYSLKHHVYGWGNHVAPPQKKRKKKKEDNRSNKIYRNEAST